MQRWPKHEACMEGALGEKGRNAGRLEGASRRASRTFPCSVRAGILVASAVPFHASKAPLLGSPSPSHSSQLEPSSVLDAQAASSRSSGAVRFAPSPSITVGTAGIKILYSPVILD